MLVNAVVLAGLAAFANGHMIMNTPKPYGSPDSSPLEPDGSNFPCKATTYDGDFSANTYEQGGTGKLAFTGSAVHGGGSCQVSITTDLEPNANSVWKVIHSIEGGCPSKTQTGNFPSAPDSTTDADTYEFTIPKTLAAGKYSLAWTWFNNVGNREMYMNCAPITVTGSGGSKNALSSLPNMFVANIGNGICTVPAKDLKFPDPGESVEQLKDTLTGPGKPDDKGECKPAGDDDSPAPSSPANDDPTSPSASPTAPTSPEEPATSEPAAPTNAPDLPVAPEQPGDGSSSASPTTEPAAPTATPETPTTPEQPSGSGSAHATGESCSREGSWNCIGGTQFQRCASGTWSAPQAVTAPCVPGESANLAYSEKRDIRLSRVFRPKIRSN